MTNTIHAAVSPRILEKADRLFSNRLSHIFIELLQNARRAGATQVTVQTGSTENGTVISFHDNGTGIEDFGKLLHLGDSNWSSDMEKKEDPAGMGFFSLLHSGVEVASNGRYAKISKEAFLGKEPVVLGEADDTQGTLLLFTRPEQPAEVGLALARVALHGSLPVVFNGGDLPREDFLKDALFVKTVNGVRIGVFNTPSYIRDCNFYGSVIDNGNIKVESVLPQGGYRDHVKFSSLYVKWDVIDTGTLHLKLPDRTELVRDDAYASLVTESRKAMFEYLASQPEHVASFKLFQEARELGVELNEASPYLEDFFVGPRDSAQCGSPIMGSSAIPGRRLVDLDKVAVVSSEAEDTETAGFTFEMGFSRFETLPLRPVHGNSRFSGYSWYDKLPVYEEFSLLIDGDEQPLEGGLLEIVKDIELKFHLNNSAGIVPFKWSLPFAGYTNEEDSDTGCCLFVTDSSRWVKEARGDIEGFSLEDVAFHLGFYENDNADSDSYDSQESYFREVVQREIVEMLGGAAATAKLELRKALGSWPLTQALSRANIKEVRFVCKDDRWDFEIAGQETAA